MIERLSNFTTHSNLSILSSNSHNCRLLFTLILIIISISSSSQKNVIIENLEKVSVMLKDYGIKEITVLSAIIEKLDFLGILDKESAFSQHYHDEFSSFLPNDRTKEEIEEEIRTVFKHEFVSHDITTEDGYILTAWNFNKDIDEGKGNYKRDSDIVINEHENKFLSYLENNNSNYNSASNTSDTNTGSTKRKVILLQHGLLDDSYTWLALEKKSLVSLLIEKNYDVWLLNSRGNVFSTGHVKDDNKRNTFHRHNKEYWNFSYSEMAQYDLPANIRYILNYTKQEKVNYVGHSQGTFMFYLAYTINPEFLEKTIDKYVSLGTVFTLFHTESWIIKLLEKTHTAKILKTLGLNDILTFNYSLLSITYKICTLDKGKICGDLINLIINKNKTNTNRIVWDKEKSLFRNEPGGTSTKNLLHWLQIDQLQEIRYFDYGEKKNLKIYGTKLPPLYDYSKFKNFSIESLVTNSDSDPFSTPEDNDGFYKLLSEKSRRNVCVDKLVNYNHLDYVWSEDAYDDLFIKIEEFFEVGVDGLKEKYKGLC